MPHAASISPASSTPIHLTGHGPAQWWVERRRDQVRAAHAAARGLHDGVRPVAEHRRPPRLLPALRGTRRRRCHEWRHRARGVRHLAGPSLRGDVDHDECDLRVGPPSPLRRRTAARPLQVVPPRARLPTDRRRHRAARSRRLRGAPRPARGESPRRSCSAVTSPASSMCATSSSSRRPSTSPPAPVRRRRSPRCRAAPTMADAPRGRSFAFAFDPGLARWARPFGVLPTRSYVTLDQRGWKRASGRGACPRRGRTSPDCSAPAPTRRGGSPDRPTCRSPTVGSRSPPPRTAACVSSCAGRRVGSIHWG